MGKNSKIRSKIKSVFMDKKQLNYNSEKEET